MCESSLDSRFGWRTHKNLEIQELAPRRGLEPQLGECLDDQQVVDRPIFHISGIAEKMAYFYATFTRVLAEEAVALTRFEPRGIRQHRSGVLLPRSFALHHFPKRCPPQGSHRCPRGAPVEPGISRHTRSSGEHSYSERRPWKGLRVVNPIQCPRTCSTSCAPPSIGWQ
jgi:hypothetical protein